MIIESDIQFELNYPLAAGNLFHRHAPAPSVIPAQPVSTSGRSVLPATAASIVGGSEAAVDVVVDHADVLHERVDARGPDEAVSL